MSVQIFENESSASDFEEDGDPLGIVISNKKRGSIFDGKIGSIFEGKRGSIFDGKRPSLFDGKRPSIFQLEGKRGSIFQLEGKSPIRSPILCDYENKKRGSIFQLFDDPYRGEEPITLRLEELRKKSKSAKIKKGVTFKELSRLETQQLRKQILYEGEYRVLNMSVLFILGVIVFGIVFMSAWHYTNQNFWVLYLVLGLMMGAVGVNLAAIKLYFHYKRFHRGKGVKDMIIENFGFSDDIEADVSSKEVEVVGVKNMIIENLGFSDDIEADVSPKEVEVVVKDIQQEEV